MSHLTPKEIVSELDKYIIGQDEAKKAVAIALRNRYRRQLLDQEMQDEITPKNIIMVGPTGVGKTEIARRLAKLMKAPFIKVEATKFTEVGLRRAGRRVDDPRPGRSVDPHGQGVAARIGRLKRPRGWPRNGWPTCLRP